MDYKAFIDMIITDLKDTFGEDVYDQMTVPTQLDMIQAEFQHILNEYMDGNL